MKDPKLPEYFASDNPDWRYACRPDANWLLNDISNWYRMLQRKEK